MNYHKINLLFNCSTVSLSGIPFVTCVFLEFIFSAAAMMNEDGAVKSTQSGCDLIADKAVKCPDSGRFTEEA